MTRTLVAAASVVALAVVCSVLPAAAQAPRDVGLHVTANDDGKAFWFTVDGVAGRNPDVHIDPGARVTIELHNNGTVPHDFWVQSLGGIGCCVAPGQNGTGSFIAPTEDTFVAYFCEPHHTLAMAGRFVVGAGGGRDTPLGLPWAVLAVAAAALLAQTRKRFSGPRRRAPR